MRAWTEELVRVRELIKVFADDSTPDDPDFKAYCDLLARVEALIDKRLHKRANMARVMSSLVSKLTDELHLLPSDDTLSSDDEPEDLDEPVNDDDVSLKLVHNEESLKSVDDQTSLKLVNDKASLMEAVDFTDVELVYSSDEYVNAWESLMEEMLIAQIIMLSIKCTLLYI